MTQTPGARLELETSWGCIVVRATAGAICSCRLPRLEKDPRTPLEAGPARVYDAARPADRKALARAERFLRAALAGRTVPGPELAVPAASPFISAVWQCLRAIPPGRTVSYAELAGLAGRPRAARAAGTACGRNELPLFIPCHRVLAAGGKPGGFTGGLAWKLWLLERERERHP